MMKKQDGSITDGAGSGSFAILWILAGTLVVAAGWRVWLGGEFLLGHEAAGRIFPLIKWRDVDQFAGWIVVMILAAADGGGQGSGGWAKKIVPWIFAAGVAVLFASTLVANDHAKALTELAAAGFLAMAAAIVGARQLSGITRAAGSSGGGGITIEELWRVVAVQWMLVWVAAEVFLRWKFRQDGASSDPRSRTILFALPAFGVGPNVMMAVGIRWWGAMRLKLAGGGALVRPRARAWMVAMVAVNVGAVCLLAGSSEGRRWWAVIGVVPMVLGIELYAVGFGREWLRSGGFWGLGLLVLGVGMFAAERMSADGNRGAAWEYTAAWRFLVGPAAGLVWVAGMGREGMRVFVKEKLQAVGAGRVSWVLVVMGVVVTAGMLGLAGVAGKQWLEGIWVGEVMEMMGVLVGFVVFMRGIRSIRG